MIHKSLPQTLTPENLGQWILKNHVEKKIHEERIPLDDSQVADLEHRSSLASRALDKLKAQLEEIKEYFKEGTIEAIPFTIYPTKGISTLTANREFADSSIEKGYTEEKVPLFGIPVPEQELVIYVDITGTEYAAYQEHMTAEQKIMHNSLFKEESLQEEVSKQQKGKKKQPIEGFTVTGGSGSQTDPIVLVKDEEPGKLPFD